MSRTELRLTGLGGQGVVLCSYIIGRACAVNGGMHATMIQSFGPEARGSACSATLAISDTPILFPYIRRPTILVAMSADGYEKYRDELADDGVLIYEEDLVHPSIKQGQTAFGVPCTRIAESLGRTIVQNMVMLGFITRVTQIVPPEAMHEAVRASVPAGTEELNLKALDAGLDYPVKQCAPGSEKEQVTAVAAAGQ